MKNDFEKTLLSLLLSAGEFIDKIIVEGRLYDRVALETYHEVEDFLEDFCYSIKTLQKELED